MLLYPGQVSWCGGGEGTGLAPHLPHPQPPGLYPHEGGVHQEEPTTTQEGIRQGIQGLIGLACAVNCGVSECTFLKPFLVLKG